MAQPIVFPPDSAFKGHKKHGLDELDPNISQAAVSLQSGAFQYVFSSFLSQATSYLTEVSASALDPETGKLYLLRRSSPELVILDMNGNVINALSNTGIVDGHSIKIFPNTSNENSTIWVADMGSQSIRTFDTSGNFISAIGPNIPASGAHDSVTLGKVRRKVLRGGAMS